ncbi:tail protein X [Pseudomonas flexibilis]|uniref:Tail protein X n=1 Tax=Pseudomonas flexibilis TaxID=706570 RepID=A0A0B3BQB6_9PSED|nr:tail protein X [Pseudomonas flexibilis]KHO66658.1 tail protein X [Pseudomonas flexibilis]SCY30913.1 P2-like prophage tail protein X [Pseudomonas flexibilis]
MDTIRATQGDTLDAICWRYYGRTAGVVEQVLEANPGLASLGPVLPIGTLVRMPAVATQATQRDVVNLWD